MCTDKSDSSEAGRKCASPRCDMPVTNPQSGYCDSCLGFQELVRDDEDARAEAEANAHYATATVEPDWE